MDELLRFDDGTLAYITELAPDRVSCVLLDEGLAISSGSRVVRTGEIVAVPVGPDLLGRVVDPLGRPLFSALRELPVPASASGRLWQAAELVREHRGDGHLATLVSAGLG